MSILAMAATALLAFMPFFVDAASRDAGNLRRTFRSPQGAARANTESSRDKYGILKGQTLQNPVVAC